MITIRSLIIVDEKLNLRKKARPPVAGKKGILLAILSKDEARKTIEPRDDSCARSTELLDHRLPQKATVLPVSWDFGFFAGKVPRLAVHRQSPALRQPTSPAKPIRQPPHSVNPRHRRSILCWPTKHHLVRAVTFG
jgi:hypothetical protein